MLASTSTSKKMQALAGLFAWSLLASSQGVFAQEPPAPGNGAKKEEKTLQAEEDDYSSTPYTEYGEFNEEADEAADTKFFQYGRLFGVSVGVGFAGAMGNRGALYQSGFPLIDFKVHYWFDFNFAMDLGLTNVNYAYTIVTDPDGANTVDKTSVGMVTLGIDLKYYFETKNMSAAISFANPYLLLGIAQYAKTETSTSAGSGTPENSLGVSVGAGLEFAVKPKKAYMTLETKFSSVRFVDTDDPTLDNASPEKLPNIPDRNGLFYSVVVSLLFTW
jgi:hypothetical protein